MTANDSPAQTRTFTICWWILLIITLLSALGHLGLLFTLPGEELLFLGWTVLSVYAAVIVAVPYKQGERWAWNATWLFAATFALVPVYNSELGTGYLAIGIVVALCQLLTMAAFRRR